jgi:hypothetical protein
MPVTSYSRTPASNNAAPPNGAPEGMSPGSVNNTIRQIMTDIAQEASKGAARVLESVAGTNTITAGMAPTLDAYSAGMIIVFTPANTNTGATTLSINGLSALDILKAGGSALTAGDLVVGVPAVVVLDSGADDFFLFNPASTSVGSFTGTLTGYASNPTGTVSYRISNNVCTLFLEASITGTSNATSLTMTGLSAAVTPGAARFCRCAVTDNNLLTTAGASVSAAGVITFSFEGLSGFNASNFAASGTKGLPQTWLITYPL